MELRGKVRVEQIGIGRYASTSEEFRKGVGGDGWPKRVVLRFSPVYWVLESRSLGLPDISSSSPDKGIFWFTRDIEVVVGPVVGSAQVAKTLQEFALGEDWEVILRPLGTGDPEHPARASGSSGGGEKA